MSITLDRVLEQASDQYPETVSFSPEDVTVLLYALSFLERKSAWLDEREDPLDEITPSEWDTIEKLVASVYEKMDNPLIGVIFPLVLADVPDNCLLCDGTTYDRTDYPMLYDLLDGAFIVDADTFVVPDLRSRVVIGAGTGDGLDNYAVGDSGGVEAVTLTTDKIPAHQHGLFQTTGLAVAPGELAVTIPFLTALGATDLAGGGGSHENRQPFTALNFVIVAL